MYTLADLFTEWKRYQNRRLYPRRRRELGIDVSLLLDTISDPRQIRLRAASAAYVCSADESTARVPSPNPYDTQPEAGRHAAG
jgi:hypothetical protein